MAPIDGPWIAARRGAPVFEDPRGRLTAIEFDGLPFKPVRAYVINVVPRGAHRGGHASRGQARFLAVLGGHARMTLDNGHRGEELELRLGDTLLLSAGVWHEIEALDDDLSILVLADGPYDPSDYVSRDSLPLDSSTPSQTAEI